MAINQVTLEMLEMLPSWMKMRTDPENSQGAKYLDAVGTQLSDLEDLIDNILLAHHLDIDSSVTSGVDVTSIDILYKVEVQKETLESLMEVYAMLGEATYPLTKSATIYDFYKTENEDRYYLDAENHVLYIKGLKVIEPDDSITYLKFDSVVVNEAVYTEILDHSVWGAFDEIGLLLGCPRLPRERNPEYKKRLTDVFKHPGNSTRRGLTNYLSRSLGISKEQVKVQDLSDEFIQSLINADGTLKAELKEYLTLSNKINLSSSNTYWDILEENRIGLSYLPLVWNVPLTKWNQDSIQNGIGDAEDILVAGPERENVTQEFDYHVSVEGLRINSDKIYPEHDFKYRVFAKGYKYEDGYAPENYKYSVIASELIPLVFNVKAHKEYTHDIGLSFGDFSAIPYTSVTEGDKKPANYVTKNVVIQPGSIVMNPDRQYIEVLANLSTINASSTPEINWVRIDYKTAGGIPKHVIISGNANPSVTGVNEITTGFEANTWNPGEYPNPALRVRSDTNDQYRTEFITADSSLQLTKGEYQKTYNSEGDWADGENINLSITASGTLKLSN